MDLPADSGTLAVGGNRLRFCRNGKDGVSHKTDDQNLHVSSFSYITESGQNANHLLYTVQEFPGFAQPLIGNDPDARNSSDKIWQKMDGDYLRKWKRIFDKMSKNTEKKTKDGNNLHKTIYNLANLIYNIFQMGKPVILKEEIN